MATGTPTRVSAPAFHADDPEETTEYRSLSVTALVALLFGFASPLCFGHVLLMLVPLIGIALALIALREIAASDGAIAGRWAALTGLALCVVFGVAPYTRALVIRTSRTHQAEEFGQGWIKFLADGETEKAWRLTVESTRPAGRPEPGMPEPKKSPYEIFTEKPIVKALVAAGKDADIRFEGTDSYQTPSFKRVIINQRYAIVPKSSSGDTKPLEAILTLQRGRLESEGRSRWLVISLTDADQTAAVNP